MFTVLKNYLDNMSKTVKKEQVVDSFENIMVNIKEDVIPTLETLINDGDEAFIKDNKFLSNLSKMSIRSKDNKEFLVIIKRIFTKIVTEEGDIAKLITKDMNDYITSKGATAKDLTIMKLVTDLNALAFYVMDLCYYVLVGKGDTNIPKIRLEDVRKNSDSFLNIIRIYHMDFSKYIKEMHKVSDETVNKENASVSMMDKLFSTKGKFLSLPTSGFNGNPIYHFRMWLTDKEVERYNLLKEKKKLIELKVLELKLEQQRESNPKLKTQIEYYEDKIGKIEYNIKEIEDDEGGMSDYIPIVL